MPKHRVYTTYTFSGPTYGWHPELRIQRGHAKEDSFQPTLSTYNRFVDLANSGNYVVEIMGSDHGVAFQLRRK